MVQYQTKITINSPLKRVYDFMADYKKMPQWMAGLQKVEVVSGSPGEVDFRSRYFFEEKGRRTVFEERVTRLLPYKYVSFLLESESLYIDGTITYVEKGSSATEITVGNKVKGRTLMMKLLLPFFKKMMKNRQRDDFNRLKTRLEQ